MTPPLKVIIDTDPGVDDAIALLMALAWPDLNLAGITTVGGNVSLARATRNTLALLEYAGRGEVPVAMGAANPIGGRYRHAPHVHGKSGLSRRLPEPKTGPVDATGVDFLAKKLTKEPGGVTLVALGPLTNLAQLLIQHPDALSTAASLVVMGGAVEVPGNVTPHAEFNFHSDPVAAQRVLSSGIPLTLIDLAASGQVSISRAELGRLSSSTALGSLAVQLLANWFRRDPRRQHFQFHDPLAVAVALQPGLIEPRHLDLAVEDSDTEHMGMVRVGAGEGPVAVAKGVDGRAFFSLLDSLFRLKHR